MDNVIECLNSNADLYKTIVDPKDWSEHHVDKAWAERNFKIREFYLARDQGQYVGFASYQKLGLFAYIGYFYISRAFHRKGYGKALMNFMEMRTVTDNVLDLRLFCNPKSTWAVKFYQAQGFKILETEKAKILAIDQGIMTPFYEEDSYFMQKRLKAPKMNLTMSTEAFPDG
jgi:ribosomal protein S18 acetylase RimI-like enzyme